MYHVLWIENGRRHAKFFRNSEASMTFALTIVKQGKALICVQL